MKAFSLVREGARPLEKAQRTVVLLDLRLPDQASSVSHYEGAKVSAIVNLR
jgi:hypothetical protein